MARRISSWRKGLSTSSPSAHDGIEVSSKLLDSVLAPTVRASQRRSDASKRMGEPNAQVSYFPLSHGAKKTIILPGKSSTAQQPSSSSSS